MAMTNPPFIDDCPFKSLKIEFPFNRLVFHQNLHFLRGFPRRAPCPKTADETSRPSDQQRLQTAGGENAFRHGVA